MRPFSSLWTPKRIPGNGLLNAVRTALLSLRMYADSIFDRAANSGTPFQIDPPLEESRIMPKGVRVPSAAAVCPSAGVAHVETVPARATALPPTACEERANTDEARCR